jgi:hypothetical protein
MPRTRQTVALAASPVVVAAKTPPTTTPSTASSEWSCSQCTFLNPATSSKCHICQQTTSSSNGAAALLAAASLVANTTARWLCSSCTFSNDARLQKCVMCSTAKSAIKVPTAAAIIAARRSESVTPKGVAGTAASSVYSNSALIGVISHYLVLTDLQEFRQVSKTVVKAVTTYVRAPNNGMAERLWEKMAREPLHAPLVAPIKQFQADVAAAGILKVTSISSMRSNEGTTNELYLK